MSDKDNVDHLIQTLHDLDLEQPDQQYEAAIALGKLGTGADRRRVVEALVEALQPNHQALTRAHAAEALGKLKDPSAISSLVEATKQETEKYQLVRSYAARALGLIEESATVTEVFRQLSVVLSDDPFFGARAEAAEALGKLIKLNPDDYEAKNAVAVLNHYKNEERKRDEDRSKRVLRELYVALHEEAQDVVEAAEQLERSYQKAQTQAETLTMKLEKAGVKIGGFAIMIESLDQELKKASELKRKLERENEDLKSRLV